MKKIYAILAIGFTVFASGQEQNASFEYGGGNLEPSTSALLKFDDVPVSLYTGVPEVSIPLLSLPTRSKDISLNISMNYHAALVGWTINYGGSITRVIENTSSEFKSNEFGFANNTRFASDVYKFNFMGHSGSFFLKKDGSNNLVPSMLVNKGESMKIEADFNPTTYFVNSFTIYDSKGYRFVFDKIDKNVTNSTIIRETRVGFHLSAIYDNNGKKLISFAFNEMIKQEQDKKAFINKVTVIESEGFGKALFTYSSGSSLVYDPYMRVTGITLSDLNLNLIKKIDLSNQDKLVFRDATQNKSEEYKFSYSDGSHIDHQETGGVYGTDKFGYPNYIPKEIYGDSYDTMIAYQYAAVNPYVSTKGVLEKIGLPTGGSILYEYESNTYSFYQGSSISKILFSGGSFFEDPDFYYNYYPYEITFPYNHTIELLSSGWITNNLRFTLTGDAQAYCIYVQPDKYFSELSNTLVYPSVNIAGVGLSEPHYRPYNMENFGYGKEFVLNAGRYFITVGSGFEGMSLNAYHTIRKMRRNPNIKKWKYGGGRRIKRIAHFDTDVPAQLYRIGGTALYPQYKPVKETTYSYNLFNEPNRSSGNLVCDSQMNFSDKYGQMEFVGYSNVTVKSTENNGKTEYTFSTSADYPLELIDMAVSPSVSKDYKRGLLKNKKVYDNTNTLLHSSDYGYLFFDENDQINYFDDKVVRDRTGKAKLGSETTTLYIPNSNPVFQSTNYSYYNDTNRSLDTKESSNSNGEILKSKFFYHTGNSPYSQNRISEIEKVETYRNSTLLSTNKINYGNTWSNNVSYLPQSVAVSKAGLPLETRLKYNFYDEYSNVLEVQQENGIKTAYIWGYNKTQTIAKIENATYAAVQSQVANLQSLSDSGTESNLITALNTLRTSLPNAVVTTFTYKPLIGISTMTDSKGDKMTYEYDEFNRLKLVKDKNGNILSENQYHYKPQN